MNQRVVRRLEDVALLCGVRCLPGGLAAGPGRAMFAGNTIERVALLLDEGGKVVATFPLWSDPLFGPEGQLIARRGQDRGPPTWWTPRRVSRSVRASSQAHRHTGTQAWLSPTASQFLVVGPYEQGNVGPAPIALVDAQTFDTIATLTDVVPGSPPAWGMGNRLMGVQ